MAVLACPEALHTTESLFEPGEVALKVKPTGKKCQRPGRPGRPWRVSRQIHAVHRAEEVGDRKRGRDGDRPNNGGVRRYLVAQVDTDHVETALGHATALRLTASVLEIDKTPLAGPVASVGRPPRCTASHRRHRGAGISEAERTRTGDARMIATGLDPELVHGDDLCGAGSRRRQHSRRSE